jgi:hypothetical protein
MAIGENTPEDKDTRNGRSTDGFNAHVSAPHVAAPVA